MRASAAPDRAHLSEKLILRERRRSAQRGRRRQRSTTRASTSLTGKPGAEASRPGEGSSVGSRHRPTSGDSAPRVTERTHSAEAQPVRYLWAPRLVGSESGPVILPRALVQCGNVTVVAASHGAHDCSDLQGLPGGDPGGVVISGSRCVVFPWRVGRELRKRSWRRAVPGPWNTGVSAAREDMPRKPGTQRWRRSYRGAAPHRLGITTPAAAGRGTGRGIGCGAAVVEVPSVAPPPASALPRAPDLLVGHPGSLSLPRCRPRRGLSRRPSRPARGRMPSQRECTGSDRARLTPRAQVGESFGNTRMLLTQVFVPYGSPDSVTRVWTSD